MHVSFISRHLPACRAPSLFATIHERHARWACLPLIVGGLRHKHTDRLRSNAVQNERHCSIKISLSDYFKFCRSVFFALHVTGYYKHVHTHTRIYIYTYAENSSERQQVAPDHNDVIGFIWHLYPLSLSLSLSLTFSLSLSLSLSLTPTDLHSSLPPRVSYLTRLFVYHHQRAPLFLSFSFLSPPAYQIRCVSLLLHWASIQFCCWASRHSSPSPLFRRYPALNFAPIYPSPVV